MSALDNAIMEAAARGLHEIVLRESVGGWQAIAKFHGALKGPWNVGCAPSPAEALTAALTASPASETTNDEMDIFS